MKKIGKKWQMKAGETRADILDRIGGSGGGSRLSKGTRKKQKAEHKKFMKGKQSGKDTSDKIDKLERAELEKKGFGYPTSKKQSYSDFKKQYGDWLK